jgi:hypothetical protein
MFGAQNQQFGQTNANTNLFTNANDRQSSPGLFGNSGNALTRNQPEQQGTGFGGAGGALFGTASPSAPNGGGGGLFGGGQASTGGLFGQQQQHNQQQQQSGGLGSSIGLFGANAGGGSSLGGGGMFGQQGASAGGGLFGNNNNNNTNNNNTGGLFGAKPNASTGGLFGNAPQQQQQQQQQGGGLFGAKPAFGGGGLFGSTPQQQQQPGSSSSGLFGAKPPLGGGLGGGNLSQPGMMGQQQQQQYQTQFQQQQNSFFNVPQSVETQATGGPTLFGGNLAPSEALMRARQQRFLASQPPANGTTLEPVKECQDVMNAYHPQHPDYRFKAFFYNVVQDPRQKIKIQNIDERTWHELLDKVGGEENEAGLWPCRVDGFDGLYQREQAQEEELKQQEEFVNAYNACVRQINSWKEGSYEVRRTQCERTREEHAHRVLKVMRKLESFRAAYHRRVNPQLSTRRGSVAMSGGYRSMADRAGGSTFVNKDERELFEVLQELKRAVDGSGKESLSRQAQQLTTTARVKTQELSRQLGSSPLRSNNNNYDGGGGFVGEQITSTMMMSPTSSTTSPLPRLSNKPILLQPYEREKVKVSKLDLENLQLDLSVVDKQAEGLKNIRENLNRTVLELGQRQLQIGVVGVANNGVHQNPLDQANNNPQQSYGGSRGAFY